MKYDTFCVTGGAGFAGSHLVDLLLERGAGKVVVVDNFSLGKLENLKDARESGRLQIYCTDACNGVAMDKIFALEKPEVCFDLAVKPLPYSFVDPEGACLTSVEMACNLARLLREGKYKRLVHFSSCHDEETRLFTNEGFKHYGEIRGNEEVLTINTNTKDRKPPLEWNRITRVIVEDYDGDLLYFKSNRAEQLVTPNHRVFYETGRGWTKYKLAEDVARLKSPFKLMQGVWAGRDKRTVDLTRFSTGKAHWNSKNLKIPMEVPTEELFYLIGLFVGDGYTDVQLRKCPSKTGLSAKEYVKFRDDKGRFKVVNKINSKKDVTVGTCHRNFLYIPEDDKSRSKVEKCLTSLGLEYHSEPEQCSIYFSSETYHNLFDQCGEGAGNKGFPRWVLDYSPKYLAKLLEGLLDSDGNRKNLISTISPRIVADVAEICEKTGKHSHFFPIESEVVLSGRTIKSRSYCISVSTTSRSIDPLKTTRIKYKGKVWCLEVPNGNFLVERRGTVLFSGNSEAYGSAVRIPMSEDHPLNPTTPYGAGKAGADLLLRSYHELFDINMSILRPFNMYGSRQNLGAYAAVIPITIRRILRNESPILEGSGCFPIGEKVFMNPKPKNIEDVSIGENVLMSHGFGKVTNTFKRNYTGKLYQIKAQGIFPFKITEENPLLVARLETICDFPVKHRCREKCFCLKYHRRYAEDHHSRHKKMRFDRRKTHDIKITKSWIQAKDLKIGDYLSVPRLRGGYPQRINFSEEIKGITGSHATLTSIDLNNDWAYLIGLFIADGWTAKGEKEKRSIYFALNIGEDDDTLNKVKTILNKYGFSYHVRMRRGCYELGFNYTWLGRWLDKYVGTKARMKVVPEIIFDLPLRETKSFINGVLDGDGYQTEYASRISSSSQILLLQLQMLLTKLGKWASICWSKKFEQGYVSYNNEKRTRHWKDEEYIYIPINKIVELDYKGSVCNLETADHTYCVPTIVHNSQTRDFTYVKDVVEAAVTLMDCDVARGKTMNVGQGRETQIVEVIHAICDEMGYPQAGIKRAPTRLADVDRHLADISLARELLNYRPKVRLEEGIRRTVEWYRRFAPQIASANPKLL